MKMFREKQRQELKLLKQELDMMPRGENRKENQRKAREAKEIDLQEKASTYSVRSPLFSTASPPHNE
jgi:hypothetical protein